MPIKIFSKQSLALRDNFDEIYVIYFSRLKRFAKEYVFSDEEAENIVQDVFMVLWEKREVLQIHTSLVPYLFVLIKNKCLDYLRHKMVAEEYKQELSMKIFSLELMNSSFSSDEEVERIVTEAVEKLPVRCREIFKKSRIEGKKYKEIAEEMNLSINTVENQIGIALKKLRVELKDYLPLLSFLLIC